LTAIFLVAVIAGIRSLLWKVVWPVAAGCLWYFAGPFFATPLMILVILRVATTVASSAKSVPAKDGVSTTVQRRRAPVAELPRACQCAIQLILRTSACAQIASVANHCGMAYPELSGIGDVREGSRGRPRGIGKRCDITCYPQCAGGATGR